MSEKQICIATGKTCFSRKEAGDMIRFFKTTHLKWNNRGENIPQRSYYCNKCGTYHLTHFKTKRKLK